MSYYTLNGVKYTYTVGNPNASVATSSTATGAITIESSFTVYGTTSATYTVRSINGSAFYNCGGLTSITIPSTVTSIGEYTFEGCANLSSITIPNTIALFGVSLFKGCTSLTSITIPSSVATIGNTAFQNCTKLTSITIPNTVTLLGTSVFSGCTSLTSFNFGLLTSIPASTFIGCTGLTSVTVPTSVTSIGANAFQNCTGLTSVTDATSVTSIGALAFNGCRLLTSITLSTSLTTIGNAAFQGSGLTSITIPTSVTSIGALSFQDCSGLTQVTILSSVTAINVSLFQNCTGLTSITIPSSVTTIHASAFLNCTTLPSITIPTSVTSFGASAFQGCASLTSITVPTSVTSIGISAFFGCTMLNTCNMGSATSIANTTFQNCTSLANITVPSTVITIGTSAFQGCTSLASITLPSSVTTINASAFHSSGLTSITIPTSVTSIGVTAFQNCTMLNTCTTGSATSIADNTFQNCTSLRTITISTSAISIGTSAFQNSGLTSVTIPSSVKTINSAAFYNCASLTSVTVPSSVTSIGTYVFYNCVSLTTCGVGSVTAIAMSLFLNCTSLRSITIPSTVTSIGVGAFQGSGLTSITIPNAVTTIPGNAFRYCTSLISFTCPSLVTSIGLNAFQGCTSLASIVIPSSVTSIGASTFYDCTSLTTCGVGSVTTIDTSTFYNCTSLTTITIPNTVTTIATDAFYNCTSLPTINFPSSFVSLAITSFLLCTSLTSITVDANNLLYSSVNGILFNKNKVLLVLYPPGLINTSYIIPNTVSIIGTNAFSQCINLTSVTIPSSVTRINTSAFTNCNNLLTVTFMGFIPALFWTTNFTATGDTALYRSEMNTDQTLALSKLTMFSNSNTWISQVPTPTITNFSVPTKTFGDAAFTLTPPTSNSTGAFVYISSNTAVATIGGSTVTIVGAGSCTITAVQVENETYTSGIITATLQVNQATAVISSFSVITKTFGNAAFAITNPPSNSTGAFTYASSNTEVATIVGNTITIVGAGTSTITATQTSTANYTSATRTAVFTVNKATVTLVTFYRPSEPVCGDPPSTLLAITNSTGDITYTSSNTAIATIAGNVLTIVGAGTFTYTINQAATANHNSFVTTTSVAVAKGIPRISFSIPTKQYATSNNNFTIPLPTSNSTGAFTYTSSNTTVAYVTGNTIAMLKPGTATITVTQASTANFSAKTAEAILNINKATPSIDPFILSTKTFGSFVTYTFPSPSSTSNGIMNYRSLDSTVGSTGTYGNTLRAYSAGVVVIYGTITETEIYKFAMFDTTFAVNTSTATLIPTITNFVIPPKTIGDAPFTLTNPTSDSPGSFVYASSNPFVASIVGNVVTIAGGGNCTIFAAQVSTADYKSGTITSTIQVGASTTVLSNFSIPAKTTGLGPFTITAPITNSAGEFTYTSSDTNVAFINGSTITIIGTGTCTITATQSATGNHESASITAIFQVGLPAPTFGTFTVPAKTFGNTAFAITPPTTNSLGAFTYESSNTSVATIAGSTITIVGTGTSTITATQASTASYVVGTKTATLTVSQGTPTIGFISLSTKTFGISPFTITDPTSTSTGAFSYASSNTAVATIVGNMVTIVGAGTSTITATQASNTNYVSGTKTATLTVNKATTVLTGFSVPTKKMGDPAFSITPPTTNSNGLITYTSSKTTVATVAGTTVTVVGVGTSIITATQATTENYTSATTTATLQVDALQETTVLTNFSVPTKTFGDTPFQMTNPTTNSNGAFTYESSNGNVATIVGQTITIVGAGTSTITATQANTTNFTSGIITATLTVSQATPTITDFTVLEKTLGAAPFQITAPTTNSNGLITYTSSNGNVATIVGQTITIVGTGSSTITASLASTTNYTSGTITATFQVKQLPTITNFTISAKKVGVAPFAITAPTSNSAGAFAYTSSNTEVATVSGNTITIVKVGTSTITATQASTLTYTSATITATLTVTQGTLVLTNFSVPTKAIGDAPFTITGPTTNSTGAFTYTSSNGSVATIVGNTITIAGVGSSTITAVQASTANYTSATITTTFQVSNILPTLSNFSIPARTVGSGSFTPTPPTSNSDGAFTYTSFNTEVAVVVGNKISAVGPGTSIITATQASTANFGSGTITTTLQVNLIPTVLEVSPISTKTFGNSPFKIHSSTNNSGTPITYESSNTAVATIAGDIVTIVGAGTSTITASQASSSNYASATTTVPLTVTGLTTVLTNFSVTAKRVGDANFNLNAPLSNRSGAFTYESSNTTVATIAGNVVTIVGAGSSTITATQVGTSNHTAESITATLIVSQGVSTISNVSVPAKVFGDAPFSITPTSTSDGSFIYISSNTNVATIVGNTVTIVGAGTSTITVTQVTTPNYISGIVSLPLVVSKRSPTITNFSVPAKMFGNATFTITAPTSDSNGFFSYNSSNENVATIVRNVITIVGVGTSTITAVQAETLDFVSGSITATFTVSESTVGLSNFVVPAKTIDDPAFTITPPTTRSDGLITFESSNTSVATINGSTITIVGVGTSTITANQASTPNFGSGTITATFQVNLKTLVLSNFVVPAKTFGDAPFAIIPPTSNSTGLITYTSSNGNVATVEGNVVTIVGAGTSTISAVQVSTPMFASGTITATLQVSPATAVLTDFVIPTQIIGDAPFTITPPTSNSNGLITYESSNPEVATIVGDVITIVGLGTSTISAIQASTANYTTRTLNAFFNVKIIRTVLTNFSVPAKVFGDTSFAITNPISNSDTGAFTYRSSNTDVATIDGSTMTIVGAGTSTISAIQASTYNSTSGFITAPFVVSKRSPTITNFSVPEKTFGNATFAITAPTTDSNGFFSYHSSNENVATIVRNVITIVGIGTSTITAVQAGTLDFASGSITAPFTVNQSTISLSNFVVPAKTVDDPAFTITPPTTRSDGLITYESSNGNVATINGSTITIVGVGTSTITANQASTPNFGSGTISTTFQVNLKTLVLSKFFVPTKTFGDAPFTITPPTSNSTGLFTYTSSNGNVATVEGNVVTIVGAGTSTISAVQASTPMFASGTITDIIQVGPATTVLTDFTIPTKTFGDAPFAVTQPTTNSTGAFTYESSNPEVATIVGDVITVVGFGTSTIRAIQASTANYTTRTLNAFFNVRRITTELSNFSVPAKVFGDASFAIIPPTTNSMGAFTYKSSNTDVATITGSTITIIGAGSSTITAFQESTPNSTAAIISAPLVVSKRSPTITNFSVPAKTFRNAPFTITAPTSDSNGFFSYNSSNENVATIVRNVITIVGAGTSTITAVQAGTLDFVSGSITATFTVGQLTPTITNFSVPTKTIDDTAFTITPPTSNSDGLITYESSNTAVATIVGQTITIVGSGTSTITANQASATNFSSGTITTTFQVDLKTLLLSNFVVPAQGFGNAPFTITPPTSTSNGLFTYTSSNGNVATVEGNVVTIVGGGSSIITAVQESTTVFGSGTITATLQVNPITTVLTNLVVSAKTFGDAPFTITPPTSNSNGLITYRSSNTAIVTIAGNEVTVVGTGTTMISAVQASTSNYTSATIASTFVVNKGIPIITNFVIDPREIGSLDFTITPPTSTSSGAFTYVSSKNTIAVASGNMVSVKTIGSVTITATQAMTANHLAGTITATFLVNKKSPTISNFVLPEKTFGDEESFSIIAPTSNSPSIFTYFSSNTNVARIVKNVVTIVGAGSSIITANQPLSPVFGPGSITATLQVNKTQTVLSEFCVFNRILGDAPFTITPPTSNNTGAFTYTSLNPAVATIVGDVITVTGGGTSTIIAVQESTTNYTSATITTIFEVNLPRPEVGDLEITNKSLDTSVFTIVNPTKPVNNTGTWTYTSSDTTKATISGNVVTLLSHGIIIISGVLSSDSLYSSASVMTQFSITQRFIAPSPFLFIKSTAVSATVPINLYPILNVIYLPLTMATPENIIKFNSPNAKIGSIAEKQANRNLIINTLYNMFNQISVIVVPTALLYLPTAIKSTKMPTTKMIRPVASTPATPLVINTVVSDASVAFLCLLNNHGNSVQLNGNGKTAGGFMRITKENDIFKVQRTDKKKKTVITNSKNGDSVLFGTIRIIITSI